jgi:hypothetical protein
MIISVILMGLNVMLIRPGLGALLFRLWERRKFNPNFFDIYAILLYALIERKYL